MGCSFTAVYCAAKDWAGAVGAVGEGLELRLETGEELYGEISQGQRVHGWSRQ
jgi:hypothetical protein